MLASVKSAAVIGIEAIPIDVEVDVASRGLPSLSIVGLPNKGVEESRDRVRSALGNTGIDIPPKRITINLAPADIPKMGPAYDLPIALGLILASQIMEFGVSKSIFIGELSLDGRLRPVNGVLPITIMAREKGIKAIFLPRDNAREASVIKEISIFPVSSLREMLNHLADIEQIPTQALLTFDSLSHHFVSENDMSDVHGQEQSKRCLEIAAAGAHNVFLNGSPGSGKTMLSRIFTSILPSVTESEAIEITKIYSIAGNLPSHKALILERPFRSPHHTISRVGLIGGGSVPKPGEISLSHRGVLFLDEFPEFPRDVIESLRQPMEDGVVTISRALGTIKYPTRFSLIAAANPCPCGWNLSKKRNCVCPPGQIDRYIKKISGPILDRIDLHVEVPEVEVEKLAQIKTGGETSISIRDRVDHARKIQIRRFDNTSIRSNAEMTTKQVKEYCPLTQECQTLLVRAIDKLKLTARSYFKVIKIARTIADLEGEENIEISHIAEALQYRPKSR